MSGEAKLGIAPGDEPKTWILDRGHGVAQRGRRKVLGFCMGTVAVILFAAMPGCRSNESSSVSGAKRQTFRNLGKRADTGPGNVPAVPTREHRPR